MNLNTKIKKIRERIEKIPILIPAHTDEGHFYKLDGKTFPSVTTKLQVLKDQGLRNWYMNQALGYIKNLVDNGVEVDKESIDAYIEQAKQYPVDKFHDAGDIGTQIHDARQKYFEFYLRFGKFPEGLHFPERTDIRLISGLRAVQKFVFEQKYIPLACELLVYDPILELAGTLDDVGLLPNKTGGYDLVIMDLKTSNIGNKDSYYYQVALYAYMFQKLTGLRAKRTFILHISKTHASYKMVPIDNVPQLVKEAKLILKLNDALDRLKGTKAKETTKI